MIWSDFVYDAISRYRLDSAGRDLFPKLCLPWQTVHHWLPAVRKYNNLRDHGHPYELPDLEQPWPIYLTEKSMTTCVSDKTRRMWTIWGSIWLMCGTERYRWWHWPVTYLFPCLCSLSQENILTIHCVIVNI